jgi:hypothetical protein
MAADVRERKYGSTEGTHNGSYTLYRLSEESNYKQTGDA